MYQFSDSDTPDSDDGRRFKTENTRPKKDTAQRAYSRYRSPSPHRRIREERRRKSKSKSPRRYVRSRERDSERFRRKKGIGSYSKYKEGKDEWKSRSENNSSRERNSRKSNRKDDSDAHKEGNCNNFGPASPSSFAKDGGKPREIEDVESRGPALPSSVSNKNREDAHDKEVCKLYGPALPPSSLNDHAAPHSNKNEKRKSDGEEALAPFEQNERFIGPDIPTHLRDQLAKASEADVAQSDDDDVIGPLPPDMMQSKAHNALEERALQMKINSLCGGDGGTELQKREEWMTELPTVRSASLGLGPRQFRANAGPDMSDRSAWSDTPEDKLNKQAGGSTQPVDLKKEAELREVRKRDEEQEKVIKKHKKLSKREDKSLLEMHRSIMQDSNVSEKQLERRPFNREIDLKVNHFDEAQKKAILKKAQLLNDRFSSGEAKYL